MAADYEKVAAEAEKAEAEYEKAVAEYEKAAAAEAEKNATELINEEELKKKKKKEKKRPAAVKKQGNSKRKEKKKTDEKKDESKYKNKTDARNNNNITPPTLDSSADLEMEEGWTEMVRRRQLQKLRVSSRENSLATVATTVEAAEDEKPAAEAEKAAAGAEKAAAAEDEKPAAEAEKAAAGDEKAAVEDEKPAAEDETAAAEAEKDKCVTPPFTYFAKSSFGRQIQEFSSNFRHYWENGDLIEQGFTKARRLSKKSRLHTKNGCSKSSTRKKGSNCTTKFCDELINNSDRE